MQAYLKKMPEGSTLIAERTNAKTGKVVKCLVEAAPTKYLGLSSLRMVHRCLVSGFILCF